MTVGRSSLLAAQLLDEVIHPRGMPPGLVFGWLAVTWGLVVLAVLVRRRTLRVVLALLAVPDPWCVPILTANASFALAYQDPDIETGRGSFDDKPGRDRLVAIRARNPAMARYGSVCDLDKVAALPDPGARIDQTDTAGDTAPMQAIAASRYDPSAALLARGAAEDRVVSHGMTMETLIAKIPPRDRARKPLRSA